MEQTHRGQINNHKANAQMLCAYRGITFSDLARLIGWSPSSVHVILSRKNPTKRNLSVIAEALGTTVEKLREPVNLTRYADAMIPRH